MNEQKKPKLFLYYLLKVTGFIISAVGYKLPIFVAVVSAIITFIQIRETFLAVLIATVVFLITWKLSFEIAKYIVGKGLLLMEYSRPFNKSYIATYGEDYKHPSFSDYGLEPENYYSYNRRFKIDSELIPFLAIPITLLFVLNHSTERGFVAMILFLLIATSIYFIVKLIIKTINKHLSKTFPHYEKVTSYAKALSIYKKIQDEIKKNTDAFKGWED